MLLPEVVSRQKCAEVSREDATSILMSLRILLGGTPKYIDINILTKSAADTLIPGHCLCIIYDEKTRSARISPQYASRLA